MSNKNPDMEPLDLSWQSDLKDVSHEENGETVAGSDGNPTGSVECDFWPSALPDEAFTTTQQRIVESLVKLGDGDKQLIADTAGCSVSYVEATLHQISVFASPEQVPFEVPAKPDPGYSGVQTLLSEPEARKFSDGELDVSDNSAAPVQKKILDSEIETIRRRALNGATKGDMAEDYGTGTTAIGDRIRGEVGDDSESAIPPLEYDNQEQSYVLPDGAEVEALEDQPTQPQSPETSDDRVRVTPAADTTSGRNGGYALAVMVGMVAAGILYWIFGGDNE